MMEKRNEGGNKRDKEENKEIDKEKFIKRGRQGKEYICGCFLLPCGSKRKC
jgi:hypothetical protein